MMKNKKGVIIFCVLTILLLSCCCVQAADEVKNEAVDMDEAREIKTDFGVVRVGTNREELYKIFQEKDRLFVPHRTQEIEWVIFRDITSDNPHDVVTFYLKNGVVSGWKKGFNPTPGNIGSKYEYSENEKIEHWFFPPDKARWNGTEVTAIEWNLFKESQKVMFLTEYITKLGNESGKKIDIDFSKYILALNYYADSRPDVSITKKLCDVIKELLTSEGKVEATPST